MTRSRAFNRFNRLTAKRRRKSLRDEIPNLRTEEITVKAPINNSQRLRSKAFDCYYRLVGISLGKQSLVFRAFTTV